MRLEPDKGIWVVIPGNLTCADSERWKPPRLWAAYPWVSKIDHWAIGKRAENWISKVPVSLPLFPLRTVLFPGGSLRLRVFERRYLDMVRDCGRNGTGFGVCLILEGNEVGAPATPAAIGTSARIADFYTCPDGLLGIDAEGGTRFHVERTRVRDNGLIVADVRWLEVDPCKEVAAQHALLAVLLADLLEREGALPDDARLLDDAGWVGWRLAERLPIDARDRQVLLQLDEPGERLDRLVEWLPRLASPH